MLVASFHDLSRLVVRPVKVFFALGQQALRVHTDLLASFICVGGQASVVGCPVDHPLGQLEAVFIAYRLWKLLEFGLRLSRIGGLARHVERFIHYSLTVHRCEVSRLPGGGAWYFDAVVFYDADFVLLETVEDTVFC